MDKIQELKKLKALLDDNVISQKEFDSLKNDILSSREIEKAESNKKDKKSTSEVFEKPDKKISIEKIKENSNMVEGVYFIEDKNLLSGIEELGRISGFSGWGGLAESLGIKNAEKKLAKKAIGIGANIVLITSKTDPWGGVKLEGLAYKINS